MINLLPPKEKTDLIQEENWKLVLILGILVLISLFCLASILFAIKINISGKVEFQKTLVDREEKKFKTFEIEALREKITSANQDLSKLNSFYQSQTNLTEILEKISGVFPEGMYLNSLSYQKETSQISLSGFAQNRETLFDFKKNLEKEKRVSEIYFPPQNWVKPTEIDFQVNFKITSSL
ncbi:PilN domain-containing protein [Patescibacteria group bacterium]|nr:PilN domain-containing protein [Patescibacteria group bacterium]